MSLRALQVLILIGLLGVFALDAHAQFVSDDLSPVTIGNVSVKIHDEATDGCWTNLGEVKNYAKDKLELKGYKISDTNFEYYTIYVLVATQRTEEGRCFGSINIQVLKAEISGGIFGFHEVANHGGIFNYAENANNYILNLINELTSKM